MLQADYNRRSKIIHACSIRLLKFDYYARQLAKTLCYNYSRFDAGFKLPLLLICLSLIFNREAGTTIFGALLISHAHTNLTFSVPLVVSLPASRIVRLVFGK